MCAVKLFGYKRAFCNSSPVWDSTSPATLIATGNEKDFVEGIALRMTASEISALDPFEGYPHWYNRENISMLAYKVPGNDVVNVASDNEPSTGDWSNIVG
mgnify:CR=1 FL=1